MPRSAKAETKKVKPELTEEELFWDKHIDHLIDVMKGIELHKVTILTGRNGSGKSMVRKLLPQFLLEKNELKDRRPGGLVASTSMDDRAGVDPSRMMVFSRDCEWLPTGENTMHSVNQVLEAENRFMILDEIELGMGEELQAGLSLSINQKIDEALKKGLGILVITHSRTMVKYLQHDSFVNLEDMSEEEWLNRELVPEAPQDFQKRSDALFGAFKKRLKKG